MSSLTGRLPKGYAYDLGARDFLLGTTAATAECGGADRRCASHPPAGLNAAANSAASAQACMKVSVVTATVVRTSVTAPFEAPAISTAKSERWSTNRSLNSDS